MWRFFKYFVFPSHCLSRTPLNSKSIFTQTPSSSKNLCKITSRYVFLDIVFIFVLDYVDFSLGFWNLGIFEKGVGVLIFVNYVFSKFWLGWVPFDVFVSMLAPWGILIIYCGKFHHVHAFFISVVYCCMLGVWQNVLETFLCWIGLKWVPLLGFTPVFPCLTCFGQWMCVLHTLPKLCLNAMPCTH